MTAENSTYSSVDGVLFDQTRTTLLVYPSGKSGRMPCLQGFSSIEAYAFNGCNRLTAIALPDSLIMIGSYAFFRCTGLTSLEIPTA